MTGKKTLIPPPPPPPPQHGTQNKSSTPIEGLTKALTQEIQQRKKWTNQTKQQYKINQQNPTIQNE